MGELVDAAVGFPGVVFSSALAVVVCFWLLVVVGAVRVDSFDEDADLRAFGLGGMPVSVAVSLLTAIGWAVSLGGSLAAARTGWTGLAHAAGDVGLLALSALVAWGATHALARWSTRAFRDRDGSAPRDFIGLSVPLAPDRRVGPPGPGGRAPEAGRNAAGPLGPAAPDDDWPHADCA